MVGRPISLMVLLSVLPGCDNVRAPRDARETKLLTAQSAAADTLEIHLARRLRLLLEAATTADSSSIAHLIAADFKAVDTRDSSKRTYHMYTPSEELTYWQVFAGHLSNRLDREYSTFTAYATGKTARVSAVGNTHDVWTAWSYRDTAWRAQSLMLIRRVDDQPSIVRDRRYRPR